MLRSSRMCPRRSTNHCAHVLEEVHVHAAHAAHSSHATLYTEKKQSTQSKEQESARGKSHSTRAQHSLQCCVVSYVLLTIPPIPPMPIPPMPPIMPPYTHETQQTIQGTDEYCETQLKPATLPRVCLSSCSSRCVTHHAALGTRKSHNNRGHEQMEVSFIVDR